MVGRDILVTPVLTPNVTTVDGGSSNKRYFKMVHLLNTVPQVSSLEEEKSSGGTGGHTTS